MNLNDYQIIFIVSSDFDILHPRYHKYFSYRTEFDNYSDAFNLISKENFFSMIDIIICHNNNEIYETKIYEDNKLYYPNIKDLNKENVIKYFLNKILLD